MIIFKKFYQKKIEFCKPVLKSRSKNLKKRVGKNLNLGAYSKAIKPE